MIVIQRTPDGFVCFWDSPDPLGAKGVGGCNPAASPLGGRKLFVNLAYEGGPDADTVHDARLSGLTTPAVATAELLMSDGSTRALALRPTSARAIAGADYRVFAYRLREIDLTNGITPVEVVVRGPDGEVLDRQTTGIG